MRLTCNNSLMPFHKSHEAIYHIMHRIVVHVQPPCGSQLLIIEVTIY